MAARCHRRSFEVSDYDLVATLDSGQAFRWREIDDEWQGTIGDRWVALWQDESGIHARCLVKPGNWNWLAEYLCLDHDLAAIVSTFPDDEPLRVATAECRGLRLLKQDPWECLASFICSSSKQIVQIRQIVANLCNRYGSELKSDSIQPWRTFPSAARLAECSEEELRECKMGYRAPYIQGSAQMVDSGEIDLAALAAMDCATARRELMRLPGVGRKVADCVLLFAYGFQDAFPIDVWIGRGLRELYFPRRKPTRKRLLAFTETHFGPYAGYAQQYLFHYVRTVRDKS